MSTKPSLIFIPGAWHSPSCYKKVYEPLEEQYGVRCQKVTLPSTQNNLQATFKDDLDAARSAILAETTKGNNVIVIAHSYGSIVGNSCIKGLTRPKNPSNRLDNSGYVLALVLITTGFPITGFAMMELFFGITPPTMKVEKETSAMILLVDPKDMFYNDLPKEEAEYWERQLTKQSSKALFEGGEYVYAGWQDVPVWYIGGTLDKGMPSWAQRLNIGMVRAQGAEVHHTELVSSHSPFLSMPEEVISVILDAMKATSPGLIVEPLSTTGKNKGKVYKDPTTRFLAPATWFKYGLPFFIGRLFGWCGIGILAVRRLWARR